MACLAAIHRQQQPRWLPARARWMALAAARGSRRGSGCLIEGEPYRRAGRREPGRGRGSAAAAAAKKNSRRRRFRCAGSRDRRSSSFFLVHFNLVRGCGIRLKISIGARLGSAGRISISDFAHLIFSREQQRSGRERSGQI